MSETYDQYILSRQYFAYFAFGRLFLDRQKALDSAMRELSRQGTLVEVMCMAVPDDACGNCGEMFFSWQKTVGEAAGTSGSDSCFYSLSDGLVCESCAKYEAMLHVHEEELSGYDLTVTDFT